MDLRVRSLQRTNGVLAREKYRLTNEVGEFVVANPNRLYATQIRRDITIDMENRYWAWQVRIPEGRQYLLNYADGVVGLGKLPSPTTSEPIGPGDHTIQLWYDFNPRGNPPGGWQYHLTIHRRDVGINAQRRISGPMAPRPWVEVEAGSADKTPNLQPDKGVGWGDITVKVDKSQEAGVQVVLQQMRAQSVPSTDQGYRSYDEMPNFDPKADAPGFVIWLEPTN